MVMDQSLTYRCAKCRGHVGLPGRIAPGSLWPFFVEWSGLGVVQVEADR